MKFEELKAWSLPFIIVETSKVKVQCSVHISYQFLHTLLPITEHKLKAEVCLWSLLRLQRLRYNVHISYQFLHTLLSITDHKLKGEVCLSSLLRLQRLRYSVHISYQFLHTLLPITDHKLKAEVRVSSLTHTSWVQEVLFLWESTFYLQSKLRSDTKEDHLGFWADLKSKGNTQ